MACVNPNDPKFKEILARVGNPLLAEIEFDKLTAGEITQLSVSTNKVLEGDIFSLPGIPVITTNLGGVHGAGLAQAAKAKGLIKQGEGTFKATNDVVQLPVKKKWSDDMSMNNNMELLKESLRSLIKVSKQNTTKTYLLPLAGLGHGEGSIEEILPLLIKTVQASSNIKLVIPAENVNLGRQGTVRKDYTRENMPTIKAMLTQAGLLGTQPQAPVSKEVKPGVSELFESNPELANAVYEALGFSKRTNDEIYQRKLSIIFTNEVLRKNQIESTLKDINAENFDFVAFDSRDLKNKQYQVFIDRLLELGYKQDKDGFFTKNGVSAKDLVKYNITPQQKQQAQQQYFQYLKSIFKKSQIVWKGFTETNKANKWFALDKEYAQTWGTARPMLINTEDVFDISEFEKYFEPSKSTNLVMGELLIKSKFEQQLLDLSFDNPKAAEEFSKRFDKSSVISGPEAGFENNKSFYVKNTNDVYEIGSKQDIEGFKKFITQPQIAVNQRTFKDENLHQAYVKGGLEAVKNIIEKNKQVELKAAKTLAQEVELLNEFEKLNSKSDKSNSENDRLIELYVLLKNSKELNFEYSLNQLGISTQPQAQPVVQTVAQQQVVTKVEPGTLQAQTTTNFDLKSGDTVIVNTDEGSFEVTLESFAQKENQVALSYVNRYGAQIGYRGTVVNGKLIPNQSFNRKTGWKDMSTATYVDIDLIPSKVKPSTLQDRLVTVAQFKITVKSDGRMFYDNGNEVTDQTTKNKVEVNMAYLDGNLRVSLYNEAEYFVLSDNRIIKADKTDKGKETIKDPKIIMSILEKATPFKKKCS